MTQINLPFQVGQTVEVKSFEEGYRGAWFKCKIERIYTKEGKLYYSLEYLDYPDEERHETQVFQQFQDGEEECIMVRPSYPPHYHKNEELQIKGDQEPLLVVHDSWKVGDLVDWWEEGCYWSGKVLKVMKEKKALKIKLPPPPRGEGKNYDALWKDLRPSLEWSLEDGWKLPSMDGQKEQCAELVRREKEDQVSADVCEAVIEQTESVKKQKTERATQQLVCNGGDIRLNIMESDSIEAPIYDLEELIVRIEWIKSMDFHRRRNFVEESISKMGKKHT
ncbi:hypothetical protein EUTSA_v10014347mg [Eutrema salsugineum]|uniref:Agenet domain-containing protein n=1 Tax=Eutrema salsugineum TaxID=72664 RepID=V4LHU3_EUTSA|nr:hypothetical protein EUTSA_v10014347mg [Eutrema salsugineum]